MPTKRYQPTEGQRKQVEAMAGYGIPHADIAFTVDCSEITLRKYYARELRLGSIKATTKVSESLYQMAVGRSEVDPQTGVTRVISEPVVSAAIFWMKARAGWSERVTHTHKHTGNVDFNLRNASQADLDEAIAEIERRDRAADQARDVAPPVPKGDGGVVH